MSVRWSMSAFLSAINVHVAISMAAIYVSPPDFIRTAPVFRISKPWRQTKSVDPTMIKPPKRIYTCKQHYLDTFSDPNSLPSECVGLCSHANSRKLSSLSCTTAC